VIAEPSDVIRRGIVSILAEDKATPVTFSQVDRVGLVRETIIRTRPDVVVINPVFGALMPPAVIRKEFPYTRSVMLSYLPGDGSTARLWDDAISVWDSSQTIRERVLRPFVDADRTKLRLESLSQREKDVVVGVAKGLTNKQIADSLNLSPHTVGTHRRNVTAKLDIHTAAGLTVWAISEKLIRLEEISRP
jgi:DNA-binding CsgD family transcriptional regulator